MWVITFPGRRLKGEFSPIQVTMPFIQLFLFILFPFLFFLHKCDTALWKDRKYIWAKVGEVNYFPESPKGQYFPYRCMHRGYYATSGFLFSPWLVNYLDFQSAVFWLLTTSHTSRQQQHMGHTYNEKHTGVHFRHIFDDVHTETWCANNPLSHRCTLSHCLQNIVSQSVTSRKIKIMVWNLPFCSSGRK